MWGSCILLLVGKQWGNVDNAPGQSYTVYLPIAVNILFDVVANDVNTESQPLVLTTSKYTKNSFLLYGYRINVDFQSNLWGRWVAIGM